MASLRTRLETLEQPLGPGAPCLDCPRYWVVECHEPLAPGEDRDPRCGTGGRAPDMTLCVHGVPGHAEAASHA